MQLGMVGFGRMGYGLVSRLQRAGHDCVVFDRDAAARERVASTGARAATSLEELASLVDAPRNVWVMVPAGVTGSVIDGVAQVLSAGDTIIDGGNSNYRDDQTRAAQLEFMGMHYLDVGTSGGVFGDARGFCLMIGGDTEAVQRLVPIWEALAPGCDSTARTPGNTGEPTPAEQGYLHCGPAGAGHFVKMVHNGIEYGMMAAIAEGLNVLHHAGIGAAAATEHSAEETPLRDPQAYPYSFDLPAVAELWRRGSVISSWLVDLTAQSLAADPNLEGVAGRVSDSGEGRWTTLAGIDEGVPTPVLYAALASRFASRDNDLYANKVLSAMRAAFGGHAELPPAK